MISKKEIEFKICKHCTRFFQSFKHNWQFYKNKTEHCWYYKQDFLVEPGNKKQNGTYYRLKDWYITSKYDNLKEEILSFGDNFGTEYTISMNQYQAEMRKSEINLSLDALKKLQIQDDSLEDLYGLKRGDRMTQGHLIAITLWCNYTETAAEFAETFRIKKKRQI